MENVVEKKFPIYGENVKKINDEANDENAGENFCELGITSVRIFM